MSIGFCLWQTGAAKWLAVNWLVMFQKANWFVFVLSIAFFVMVMTHFIMNRPHNAGMGVLSLGVMGP